MKTLIKLTLLLFIVVENTFSQAVKDVSKKGTVAALFLSISQGAKTTAMGSAFVSLANDASAIYWNPAVLAKLQGAGAMFDRTADANYSFVSGNYNLGDMGSIGLSFTSSEYGDMKVTTIDARTEQVNSFALFCNHNSNWNGVINYIKRKPQKNYYFQIERIHNKVYRFAKIGLTKSSNVPY
ncbi:MAG: hypothetical protein Q8N83_17145 [Ignavibacteria bacterium]|nr:hypothetical protein [Ignavibacteria bacterium]